MNLMSTEITNLGPLCQATIVTFQPFAMAVRMFMYSVIFMTLLKVFASIAKAFLTFRALNQTKNKNRKIINIATTFKIPSALITIIDDSRLIAFSSIMPWISNGIYLSTGACKILSQKQLSAVVLHELHHWQQKDPLKQLSLKIAAEVFFFLPSIRDLLNHWQLKAELAADAFVVHKLGSAKPLRNALNSWLAASNSQLKSLAPIWAVAFAETQLNIRISKLNAKYQTPNSQTNFWQIVTRLSISCSVILGIMVIQTSFFAQTQAQLIIPNSAQCTQAWQESSPQSSIFTVMSRQ